MMIMWCSLCVSVSIHGPPLVTHLPCNIQDPIQLHAQCQPSYSVQSTTNEQFNICHHSILNHAVFLTLVTRAYPSLGTSFINCLPVQNTEPVHCYCVWDTSSIMDSIQLQISSSRNWSITLLSRLDRVTNWYAPCELQCNVSHTSYFPSRLYCSTQVSASVFTVLNMQLHHLHCHSNATNRFQL